jgi:hypothetical protein
MRPSLQSPLVIFSLINSPENNYVKWIFSPTRLNIRGSPAIRQPVRKLGVRCIRNVGKGRHRERRASGTSLPWQSNDANLREQDYKDVTKRASVHFCCKLTTIESAFRLRENRTGKESGTDTGSIRR